MTRLSLTSGLWLGLLVLSVLLNGILVGVLIERGGEGAPLAGPDRIEAEAPPGRFNPRAFLMALPEEVRPQARARLREGLREMRPLMRETLEARAAAALALTADPFDPERAATALQRARETRAAMEARGERVVLDIVADLEPETRRRVLAAAWSGRPPFAREPREAGPPER